MAAAQGVTGWDTYNRMRLTGIRYVLVPRVIDYPRTDRSRNRPAHGSGRGVSSWATRGSAPCTGSCLQQAIPSTPALLAGTPCGHKHGVERNPARRGVPYTGFELHTAVVDMSSWKIGSELGPEDQKMHERRRGTRDDAGNGSQIERRAWEIVEH